MERTLRKCFETNTDVNLALSKIRSVPAGLGLPSPTVILFNRPI